MHSTLKLGGRVKARKIEAPGPGLAWKAHNFLPNVFPGLWRSALARALHMAHIGGRLYVRHIKADGSVVNYGLVSCKLVTDAFVEFMVDQLQTETSEWGDFKYHDSGVGVTGAAVGDTDIETTDGEARATGSQTEGATADIYKSVGTISYTTTKAITEHGLFSTLASTTLMDRHTFSAINVANGDSIQFTYQLTVSDGG